jgi:hypothetical protein
MPILHRPRVGWNGCSKRCRIAWSKTCAWPGIVTIEAANRFVKTWLLRYNLRFAVPPAQVTDLYRPSPGSRELDRMLCGKTTRVVPRDWTAAHTASCISSSSRSARRRSCWKIIWMARCGSPIRARSLPYHAITSRPKKVTAQPSHPAGAFRQTEAGASVASPFLTRASPRRSSLRQ